jgi:hypothetical protein
VHYRVLHVGYRNWGVTIYLGERQRQSYGSAPQSKVDLEGVSGFLTPGSVILIRRSIERFDK